MDSRETITAFLRSLIAYHEGNDDKCVESVLLEKGTWFEGRRHSDDYETTKAFRKQNRPKIKQCYFNSQFYCCEDESARYFEGYVKFKPNHPPAEHAWIEMADGGVVDFTFEALERQAKREKLKCDTSNAVYLGLEIPRKFIRQKMAEDGVTQPLLDLHYLSTSA